VDSMRLRLASALALLLLPAAFGAAYFQTNLTSDIPGLAANTDPNLRNPWGVAFSATSPFWVSDQASGLSTLYNGAGAPQALVVTIPPPSTPPGGPTGVIFNSTAGFGITGGPATFVFSTLAGTIAAWRGGTSASIAFAATDGAVYTGLATGSVGANNFLYAADSRNGKIDVLDSSFQKTTLPGSFTNPNVPSGFTPYNVQNIGGKLYVTYEQRNAPGGFVSVFDTNGNLLQSITDAHLDEPWGVALAPSGFGMFANDLLIGNFGDGTINAFDPSTGAFLGVLTGANGNPIANPGLWALEFRAPGSGFNPNTLFFTAGINNEVNGLFGTIQAVPEPRTFAMIFLALVAIARFTLPRQTDLPRS